MHDWDGSSIEKLSGKSSKQKISSSKASKHQKLMKISPMVQKRKQMKNYVKEPILRNPTQSLGNKNKKV